MKVCYSNEMKKIDEIAIHKAGIPGIVLMENAGIACIGEIQKIYNNLEGLNVALFCGKGNNGGDGFVIARHLHNKKCNVTVYLTCGKDFSKDAHINFDIIKSMDLNIVELTQPPRNLNQYDLIIDAILGTGIKGEVTGLTYDVINEINSSQVYTLSVDVPSGIDSDRGQICSVCVKADKTVTFAAYKAGLLLYPGADYAGDITVADISIPEFVLNNTTSDMKVTDIEFFRENMPSRHRNSQKGDYGKLLIIAGSEGLTGAAYLCSQSAMLCGSGLVTLAVPDCVNAILEAKTTEVMTMPVKSQDGFISSEATDKISQKIKNIDAVLIGPGLGVCDGTYEILRLLLSQSEIPVIVDADAINCLSNDMSLLKNKKCNVILTPHSVEFSRLSGLSLKEIESNRLEVSRNFAKEFDVTLILKGSRSIVTGSGETQYINITGNPGLATAGSGDVLAGITASFAAREINTLKACAMAVFLHGICGDIASGRYGMESLVATDVMQSIPDAYNHILQVEK